MLNIQTVYRVAMSPEECLLFLEETINHTHKKQFKFLLGMCSFTCSADRAKPYSFGLTTKCRQSEVDGHIEQVEGGSLVHLRMTPPAYVIVLIVVAVVFAHSLIGVPQLKFMYAFYVLVPCHDLYTVHRILHTIGDVLGVK